jgi:DNA-binding CsgD family transcriptional regulator/tetratricopeptide (TPR) repeat protein
VLWGPCVRFGAEAVPFAPLIIALERWLRHADARARADVLEVGEGLGALLPSLARPAGPGVAVRLVPLIDEVISRICLSRPAVLVVDDIHWADLTSLDALAYVVAGFRDQSLLLVATYRDEALGPDHPLHGWLADLRRLPDVDELKVDRLSEVETRDQVAWLVGDDPAPGLVADVHARSGGNPYLTELLLKDVPRGAIELPVGVPEPLREALVSVWNRLSLRSREVVRLLAVGGHPMGLLDLVQVGQQFDLSADQVGKALLEAAASGVVVVEQSGMYWFRHPLFSEVLYATFLPAEAAQKHAAFVRLLESVEDRPAHRVRRLVDLALHHELAGHIDESFVWSLRAAAGAAEIQGFAEQAHQLGRVLDLWPRVTPGTRADAGDQVELLRAAADACHRTGAELAALRYLDRAHQLVDPFERPLLAAGVLRERSVLVFLTGRVTSPPLEDQLEAVALAAAFPNSQDYVLALASAAEAELWRGQRVEGEGHAELAVQAAARNGSKAAMAVALGVRAFARLAEPSGLRDGEDSYRLAIECGDQVIIEENALHLLNVLTLRGRMREAADVLVDAFRRASTSTGGGFIAFLPGETAQILISLGDLSAAREFVQQGLALRAAGIGGARVRLAAADLALKLDRLDEAAQHLRRAEELVPALADHIGLGAAQTYCPYLIAVGKADEALAMVRRILPGQAPDPRFCDELLMWAARAAAELAVQGRDRHDAAAAAAAVSELDGIVGIRTAIHGDPFQMIGPEDLVQRAVFGLFEAESGRCRGSPDQAALWRRALVSCHAVGWRIEEAVAGRRCAEAVLAAGGSRDEVATLLREGHRFAVESGVGPLRKEIAALARMARISLADPDAPALNGPLRDTFPAATSRELDVLRHLITGRSYGEIGRSLFISDKTVSVHVSNLLRKTGARNRHELAALARRLGVGPAEDGP